MTNVNTTPRRTEGATLFVVVLMVLFLLAAVMAITAQLTIAGRKSTSDQENSLRAQYAAESSVARAQARMAVLNKVLTSGTSTVSGVQFGVVIPKGTYASDVASKIMALCSVTSLPFPSKTTPLCGSTDSTKDLFAGSVPSSTQLGLFNTYVSQAALVEAGAPVTDATSQNLFWQQTFGGTGNGASLAAKLNNVTTTGTSGLIINRVMQTGRDNYKIYMSVPDVNIKAESALSSQALRLSAQNRQYVLSIVRKYFSDYALMTNHHYADMAGENSCKTTPTDPSCHIFFTDNTTYTGPVHTNQNFNFAYANAGTGLKGANFKGPVTSAGCVAGSIIDGASDCSAKQPGAYYYSRNSSGTTIAAFTKSSTSPLSANGQTSTSPILRYGTSSCPSTYCTQPTFNGGVNWNADYVKMPDDTSDQVKDAKNGGLYITTGVTDLSLSVSDLTLNGVPGTHAQVLSYTKTGGSVTQLAINAVGRVFIKVGTSYVPAVQSTTTFEWVDASSAAAAGSTINTFNGVTYVDSTSGITSLHGPARTTVSDPATAKPAIAKFMQMTVVSSGTIGITGDLKYEDRPCDTAGNCTKPDATNVLGIYAGGASNSDVTIVSKDSGKAAYAPDDVNIDAVLMSKAGSVRVDGHDKGSDHGKVYLTGGIIENYYGAFGMFGGTTPTGYGRNFVYDTRMGAGLTPPSFPGTNTWISQIEDTSANVTTLNLKSATLIRQSLAAYKTATGSP